MLTFFSGFCVKSESSKEFAFVQGDEGKPRKILDAKAKPDDHALTKKAGFANDQKITRHVHS